MVQTQRPRHVDRKTKKKVFTMGLAKVPMKEIENSQSFYSRDLRSAEEVGTLKLPECSLIPSMGYLEEATFRGAGRTLLT